MRLSLDIKRATLLALSLAVAFAVVGPACFLFAQSAFAAPHSHAPMSNSDRECGGPGGSASTCPHDNQVPSTPAVSAAQLHVDVALPATPVAVEAPTQLSALALAPADESPPGPVAHLTPLRL